MLELAKNFLNKECLIYTFNSQIAGTITEVSPGAILIQCKNSMEAVNLDLLCASENIPEAKTEKRNPLC